jgi:hypothetical protein
MKILIFLIVLLFSSICLSNDIYDMVPVPPEPKIRIVMVCDTSNQTNKTILTTIKELQKKGLDVLILDKKRTKLKIVLYIGLEAKEETTKNLTQNEIIDWIYRIAENKLVPIPENSPFKQCTESCPEGTCEVVEEKIKEETVQYQQGQPRRLFRLFR